MCIFCDEPGPLMGCRGGLSAAKGWMLFLLDNSTEWTDCLVQCGRGFKNGLIGQGDV